MLTYEPNLQLPHNNMKLCKCQYDKLNYNMKNTAMILNDWANFCVFLLNVFDQPSDL